MFSFFDILKTFFKQTVEGMNFCCERFWKIKDTFGKTKLFPRNLN